MEGVAPHQALMRVLPSFCALFLAAVLQAAAAEPPADHFRLTTDGGRIPSVAVDSEGCSHITWSSRGVIMYLRVTGRLGYDASGQMVDLGPDPDKPAKLRPIPVSEILLTDSTPKIAVDRQGNAHIVCGLNSRIGVKYFKVSPGGTVTSGSVEILPRSTAITYLYSSPSIAIDSSPDADLPVVTAIVEGTQRVTTGGHYDYLYLPFIGLWPLFVYPFETTYGSEQVVVFRLDSTGKVTSLLKLFSDRRVGQPAYRAEHPSVAVDSTGQVHAVWKYRATDPQNSAETHDFVAYQNEAEAMQSPIPAPTWVSPPDTVGGEGGPVLACDTGDRLHVAWYDPQGKGRIWYSRLSETGGQEVAATVVSSADAVVTGTPALAVDTGLVRIVWPDSRPSKPELGDSRPGVFFTALLNNEVGTVERPPRDRGNEADFRLSDGLDAVSCPAIGVSPFGVPTIVWEDQRYDGRNEILVFRPPWTFLVYVSADNNLCNGYLKTVLNGMERGAYNPCVTTVVQFDGATDKDSRRFLMRFNTSADTTFADYDNRYATQGKDFWYVGPNKNQETACEVDMGNPTTLTDFVKWGTVSFPATRTMLSIDDHGSGWLPRFSQESGTGTKAIALDENGTPDHADDTSLSLKELWNALKSSGRKPDVLFLDACLMGMLEVAYELRERADYLLLSETTFRMNPLYEHYLPGLKVDADALATAKQMASCFETYFAQTNDSYTIAAIDGTKVEALAEQVLALTQAIMPPPDQPAEPNRPNLKAKCFEACGKARKVDEEGRFTDLYDWCDKLKAALTDVPGTSAISTGAQAVMSLISPVGDDKLVVAEGHGGAMTDTRGISIYFPFARPDIGVGSVPEDQEKTVGGFVALREAGSKGPDAAGMLRAFIRYDQSAKRGPVILVRPNSKIKVWALDSNNLPTEEILTGSNEKTWDMANDDDKKQLQRVRSRLMVEGCEIGTTELALFQNNPDAADPWGAGDEVKITVFKVELKSIEFTSDHGLLMKNPATGSVWGDSKTAYEKPEWVAGSRSNPISQSMGTTVTAMVKIRFEPPGIDLGLIGEGAVPCVSLGATNLRSTGTDQEVQVTATASLPSRVEWFDSSIGWRIRVGTTECAAGASGPHRVYVTYDIPKGSVITEQRINDVCTAAFGLETIDACASAISTHLISFKYSVGAPNNGPPVIWLLHAGKPYRSQCPGLAIFIDKHFQILGLGAGSTKYCRAMPDGSYSALDDGLGYWRPCTPGSPGHSDPTSHDDTSDKEFLYMIDASGAPNNYEATCMFSSKYYAVGIGVFSTPAEVVRSAFGRGNTHWFFEADNPPWDIMECLLSPWTEAR